MGARRNFSSAGRDYQHFKKLTHFRRVVQKIDHFSARRRRKRNFLRSLRRFRLKYRVSNYLWRAPMARAKILGYFVGRQYMTSMCLIPEGSAPLAPPCGRPWSHLNLKMMASDTIFKQIALTFSSARTKYPRKFATNFAILPLTHKTLIHVYM